jgi:hypothetical protein
VQLRLPRHTSLGGKTAVTSRKLWWCHPLSCSLIETCLHSSLNNRTSPEILSLSSVRRLSAHLFEQATEALATIKSTPNQTPSVSPNATIAAMSSEQILPTSDLRGAAQDSKRDAAHKHKWGMGAIERVGRGEGQPRPLRPSDSYACSSSFIDFSQCANVLFLATTLPFVVRKKASMPCSLAPR